MTRHFLPGGLLLSIAAAVAAEDAARTVDTAVREAAAAYVTAFNARDAAAVGRLWAEQGVYINRETGERSAGRSAIQADLERTFAEYPQIRLQFEAGQVRMVTADVAQAEAVATLIVPDEIPQPVQVSALYVKTGDVWLLNSVEETPLAAPETSHEALAPLAYLVGDWRDETAGVTATSSFHWSPNGAYLIRSFSTSLDEVTTTEGTQVIGWDPRTGQVRSWTFNSDGSFGEAVWSKAGGDWLIKSTQTLADGGTAAGTYVVTPVDDDTMTVQLIGHEINGASQPGSEPVRVVRAKATASAGASPAGDGAAAPPAAGTTEPHGGAR